MRVAIELVIEFVILFVIAFVIVLWDRIFLGSLPPYSSSTFLLCARSAQANSSIYINTHLHMSVSHRGGGGLLRLGTADGLGEGPAAEDPPYLVLGQRPL